MIKRKFYLQTETGERFALNGETGVWLASPSGLGSISAAKYTSLSGGFYTAQKKDEQQATVTGELVFTRDPYQAFQRFANFAAKAGTLYLAYKPGGAKTYLRRVELFSLSKGELSEGKWLRCDVAFRALTPWYLPTATKITLYNPAEGASSILPFYLDGTVRLAASGAGDYSAEIIPDGHMPAAIRLEYTGDIYHPVITLTGESTGTVYGSCRIDADLENVKLILDTSIDDSFIVVEEEGVRRDIIDLVDVTSDPFFRVPLGETCILRIQATDTPTGEAEASVKYYYKAV